MRWLWLIGIAVVAALVVAGCAATKLLPTVKLDPSLGPPAPPPILGTFANDPPVTTLSEWQQRRAPLVRQALIDNVFGPFPPVTTPPRVTAREPIAYPQLENATIEQWNVAVTEGEAPLSFNMMVVLPKQANGPVPLIVMETFCGNRSSFRDPPDTIAAALTTEFSACGAAWMQPLIEGMLGRHISVAPYDEILSRGYGIALFYPGDVVADVPEEALTGLSRLYGESSANAGAIAVWAWLYSRAYDVLAEDPRIDAARVAVCGHSRQGKSALLAAAFDPRIAAVIAHQSGRGGAALSSGAEGESIGEMMKAYPYWFPPAFANAPQSAAIDQHQLLALIAPRPVLLGNGARDAWADPHAAWQAARAADPVYRLYGQVGFEQTDMRTPNHAARVEYFIRPGLHGITSYDWRMFLDFLDAQMRQQI